MGFNNYESYLLAILVMHSYATIYCIYYLPFYSQYLNLIKIFFQLDIVFIISIFLLGSRLNNAGIPFLLALVGQFFLLLLAFLLLKYRISKINANPDIYFSSFEDYELLIRQFLKSGELKENLIIKMNKNFKFEKSKLNRIILAYYCNDIMQNYKLAYNKIIKVKYDGINIFLNFQIYKCRKVMTDLCKKSSEVYKLYQYFINIKKIKSKDYKFCARYYKFSEIVLQPKTNLSRLKIMIIKLTKQKNSIVNLYTSVLEGFPNSEEVNEMFGSFLFDILYDMEKGQLYSNKIFKNRKNYNTNQCLDNINDRSIVVFSGNPQNMGRIMYANKNFINFIGFSIDLLRTYSFSNFLPCVIAKKHDSLLLNFVENCTDTIVYKSLPLFLIDSQGFLRECFISIECIGDNESINFLCSIDLIHSEKRELAVIDLNGVIYAYSKNLFNMFGYYQNNAENMNILYYLPEINFSELIIDTIYRINSQHSNKIIEIVLKTCKIQEIVTYTLFVTDDFNKAII